jgi:hypothetical protein
MSAQLGGIAFLPPYTFVREHENSPSINKKRLLGDQAHSCAWIDIVQLAAMTGNRTGSQKADTEFRRLVQRGCKMVSFLNYSREPVGSLIASEI